MASDSRSGGDYEREVRALFEHAVRDELAVAFGMQGLDVSDAVQVSVANAIVSRLDSGFRYQWDPKWVRNGSPHQWAEDGQHFARCTACLAVSPAETTTEAALAWHRQHVDAHGG